MGLRRLALRAAHRVALLVALLATCAVAVLSLPSVAGATVSCAPGSYLDGSTCSPCALGTYQPNTAQTSCLAAPAGTYVDTTGAITPTACALGKYQPNTGQTSCLPAPAGTYVDTTGAIAPTACALGTYQPETGQTSCLAAPAGKYVDTTGAIAPTACALGTYQPETGQTSCLAAPVNTYVDVTGATSPTPCPKGYYQPSIGQTACIADDVPPVVSKELVTPNPVPVNGRATLTATADDSDNIASAAYSLAGGPWTPMSASDGTFGSPIQGLTAGITAPSAPGLYNVCIRATDAAGNTSDGGACTVLVVYDPTGGFVTGGGWINSPLHACRYTLVCVHTAGKATFGFVSHYLKGAAVPSGNTEFDFHAGGLNFKSTGYQWLVVDQDGTTAQFHGEGTINGSGTYQFTIWATDGSPDTFRMQITDAAGRVVYDSGAKQALGGGSIIVHA